MREYGIPKERLEALYFDPDVPVAVAEHTAAMTWIEPPDRRARWKSEVERRAFGTWSWKSDGSKAFRALEFHREGRTLVVLYDED